MGAAATSERNWDGSTMPSQKDKLAIVTGANSGIGFAAAKALAARGAHVIIACRNEGRGRHAEDLIRQGLSELPGNDVGSVEFMLVDIGDPASVRNFARAFHERFDHLDLLINNAGVSVPAERYTQGGLEAHFAINHLGHFYLTSLLLDLLRRSKDQARVVNVSSLAHYFAWMYLDFSTLGHTRGSLRDYLTTKMANLLFTYELQRRLQSAQVENVVAVAAHPGLTHTDIWNRYYRSTFPSWLAEIFVWLVSWLPFMTSQMGALSILYAATVKNVKGGEYYGPDGFLHIRGYPVLEAGAKSSHSLEDANNLWKLSEDTLSEKFKI
ncbi:short chain dehydrogenase [Phytophthora infestans]|uniref:Short chain dehydrogenase n=1 Tax=Phytophthora infestans TaxID=4787 RepID=A0A8S9TH78_PHYIN|nr:short chain dehydrogenase [Phytophthora infestans]